jgi:hypothetical protein
MTGESFIDVDFCQQPKHGQVVAGDVFLSRKIKAEGRVISVLSDGLGSGVKAGVLANLTATMALRYTTAFVDVRRSAKTIMDTLPVCEKRKISYSTFTIVDLDEDGKTRVIEHGNPPLTLFRGRTEVPLERLSLTLENWKDRVIYYSEFDTQLDDRIVFYSDGVSQSGLGRIGLPFGWSSPCVTNFLQRQIIAETEISSRNSPTGSSPKPCSTTDAQPRTTSVAGSSIIAGPAACSSSPAPPSTGAATASSPPSSRISMVAR